MRTKMLGLYELHFDRPKMASSNHVTKEFCLGQSRIMGQTIGVVLGYDQGSIFIELRL